MQHPLDANGIGIPCVKFHSSEDVERCEQRRKRTKKKRYVQESATTSTESSSAHATTTTTNVGASTSAQARNKVEQFSLTSGCKMNQYVDVFFHRMRKLLLVSQSQIRHCEKFMRIVMMCNTTGNLQSLHMRVRAHRVAWMMPFLQTEVNQSH